MATNMCSVLCMNLLAKNLLPLACDHFEVQASNRELQVIVPVAKRDMKGAPGKKNTGVKCLYLMRRLSAILDVDYIEGEGQIRFGNSKCVVLSITIPATPPYRASTEFQVVTDSVEGGAIFNPNDDGGEHSGILTGTIRHADCLVGLEARALYMMKALCWLDCIFQFGSVTICKSYWWQGIKDFIFEVPVKGRTGRHKPLKWAMHIVCLPWQLLYAVLIPPNEYWSGWPCFVVCIGHFLVLTACIIGTGEMFGCVAEINDSLTAITLITIGTSMPDFVSSMAAVHPIHHDWDHSDSADAASINVSGSNCIHVVLGLGFPWLIAAIHWSSVRAQSE